MPRIHVCPLSRVEDVVRVTGARSLVSLLSTGTELKRPLAIAEAHHLHIAMSDIVEPTEGYILPSNHHVSDLVAFAKRWDRQAPLVVHCYAGVSRSTAAAFIAVCALESDQAETDVAQRLRRASPTATPNRKLVALADDYLGRGGRMVDAIAAIGTGVACFEGAEFELPLR
jgi:predicted protein tyrosine phosphatase